MEVKSTDQNEREKIIRDNGYSVYLYIIYLKNK